VTIDAPPHSGLLVALLTAARKQVPQKNPEHRDIDNDASPATEYCCRIRLPLTLLGLAERLRA
jgi:hypothetical protein